MSDDVWVKAAAVMSGAGPVPMPTTETLLELLKTILSEEEAAFIPTFTRPSLSLEEIRERTGLDGASLHAMLDGLLHKGAVMVTTSRSTGIEVYRLMPPFPGLFEYTMMRGETGEREKKLAVLYDQLFEELTRMIQDNYDNVVGLLETVPPMTRVVPVDCEVDVKPDSVVPCEDAVRSWTSSTPSPSATATAATTRNCSASPAKPRTKRSTA